MQKYIIAICTLLIILCGCIPSTGEDIIVDDAEINEESEEEQIIDEVIEKNVINDFDAIPLVIDNDGEYIEEGEIVACVFHDGLKLRTSPNGDTIKDYDGSDMYASLKSYRILDKKVDGDYEWFKIGEDRWVANIDSCVRLEEYRLISDFDETTYQERSPYNDDCDYFFFDDVMNGKYQCDIFNDMSEEQKELTRFLIKTMPEYNTEYFYPFDFDARKPSEMAKDFMLRKIESNFVSSIDNNDSRIEHDILKAKNYVIGDNDSSLYIRLGSLKTANGIYYVLGEHVKYFEYNYYGNVIDLSTAGTYDSENDIYIDDSERYRADALDLPYITNINRKDNVLLIEFSVISLCPSADDNKHYKLVYSNDFPDAEKNDFQKYLDFCEKYIATAYENNDNEYQLITVKHK